MVCFVFIKSLRNLYLLIAKYQLIVSNEVTISCGVPQGSVLGPLFLIYINDFSSCSSMYLHLFADDSNFFASNNDLVLLELLLNEELGKIFNLALC